MPTKTKKSVTPKVTVKKDVAKKVTKTVSCKKTKKCK